MDLFHQSEREQAIDTLHHLTALYTVEPVVDDLLDMLDWPRNGRRLLDPSAGAGAFIGRALQRLLQVSPNVSDAELSHVLQAYEIHWFAVSQARARLASILVGHGRNAGDARALSELLVRQGDFLLEGPRDQAFHAIASNPPYLRMVSVPHPLREDYENGLPEHAQADLLHSFLDRCAASLHPDGEIAFVTADRWLFSESAAKLRASIGKTLGISHLERLDAASSFYRPKQRSKGTPPRIHPVGVVMRHAAAAAMPLSEAPIFPGAQFEECPGSVPFGSVANVRIAPWLGTPGVFLIDQAEAAKLPSEYLVPAIDTDDVTHGVLGKPYRFAIRTQRDIEPCAAIMEHLDRNLDRMCQRGRMSQRWLPPESFSNFDLSQPHLLIPRIAKGLRPVRVPAGVLPVNHNLSVVASGSSTLDEIEAMLCSEMAMNWIAQRAPRLENGYLSVTTKLLRAMPVLVNQSGK